MPTFRNTTGKSVWITHNGKRIRLRPGSEIEGPETFSMYKGLIQIQKKNITLNERDYKKEPEIKPKSLNRKIIIPDRIYTGRIDKTKSIIPKDIQYVPIPQTEVMKQHYSQSSEISKASSFIKNYKKNGLPSVGICILTKDSYHLIKDCCESIFKHVQYPNTKIYIFDTGTSEKRVLTYYNSLKKKRKIPVEIIDVGEFHFSKNYNKGVLKVDTDYVMIQNNDTLVVNDYISKLMKVAVVNKVGSCGPRMLFKDGTIQHDGQLLYNHDTKSLREPYHHNATLNPTKTKDGRYIVDGITGAGVLIRTDLFNEIGGFEEYFIDIYQDVHLAMKLNQEGYINVCDRNSVIYHFDNTSRKEKWKDANESRKMVADYNTLFTMSKNKQVYYPQRPKYKFSIATLINDEDQYYSFLESLRNQNFGEPFELICLPNFNGEYSSCSEALNVAKDISQGEIVILCHQDIVVNPNWLSGISKQIWHLNGQGIKWGVLGMAGVAYQGTPESDQGVTFLTNRIDETRTNAEYYRNLYKTTLVEVQTLDELCLIVKNNKTLRFDESNFDGYHFYGADLCLNSISRGQRVFAIDAECYHLSDGFSNLEKHSKEYTTLASRLHQKWKDRFPYFRTMTARFNGVDDTIFFYVAEELNRRGIQFPQIIKVKGK